MNSVMDQREAIVVAAFGSPHGDDQVGWRVAAHLQRRPGIAARVVLLAEGTGLLEELSGCEQLIVVDACRSGAPVGALTRLEWPDPRVRRRHNQSTHGISACDALELAEQMGRIPPRVVLFGVEIAVHNPLSRLSPEVEAAVPQLQEVILREIDEFRHA